MLLSFDFNATYASSGVRDMAFSRDSKFVYLVASAYNDTSGKDEHRLMIVNYAWGSMFEMSQPSSLRVYMLSEGSQTLPYIYHIEPL